MRVKRTFQRVLSRDWRKVSLSTLPSSSLLLQSLTIRAPRFPTAPPYPQDSMALVDHWGPAALSRSLDRAPSDPVRWGASLLLLLWRSAPHRILSVEAAFSWRSVVAKTPWRWLCLLSQTHQHRPGPACQPDLAMHFPGGR